MAAGEHEPEAVVAHGADLLGLVGAQLLGEGDGSGVLAVAQRLAAGSVDRAVARGGDDPAGRARRDAGARPGLERDGERLLHGLLGEADVADEAREGGDRAAVVVAEHALDLCAVHPHPLLTLINPLLHAPGMPAPGSDG